MLPGYSIRSSGLALILYCLVKLVLQTIQSINTNLYFITWRFAQWEANHTQ